MSKPWDRDELEKWWGQYYEGPKRQLITLDEAEGLAQEVDRQPEWMLLDRQPARVGWKQVGLLLLTLGAAWLLLMLPRAMRLWQ